MIKLFQKFKGLGFFLQNEAIFPNQGINMWKAKPAILSLKLIQKNKF